MIAGAPDCDRGEGSAALIPGVSPAVYGPQDFARIAAMMQRESGVVLGERKRLLAYSRLAPLVRVSGTGTFAAYLDLIDQSPGEMAKAVSALTTNHTYFNREPHHFEHFAAEVRPDLLARAAAGQAVRLWSAGCSSGEEVWTLMMVLLGEDRGLAETLARRDLRTLASDISEDALAAARRAHYPAEALAAVPEALRRVWCRPVAGGGTRASAGPGGAGSAVEIAPELRALVRFRHLNLFGEWPFAGQFDVIFCRNVMIYFDNAAKRSLVMAFAQRLRPGGFLYIGHSERVQGEASALLIPVGPTVYQRVGA